MLSLPNYSSQVTLEEFLPLWRVVEDYIDKQKILSAGVCDFMMPLFSDLCQSAKVRKYQFIRFLLNNKKNIRYI